MKLYEYCNLSDYTISPFTLRVQAKRYYQLSYYETEEMRISYASRKLRSEKDNMEIPTRKGFEDIFVNANFSGSFVIGKWCRYRE